MTIIFYCYHIITTFLITINTSNKYTINRVLKLVKCQYIQMIATIVVNTLTVYFYCNCFITTFCIKTTNISPCFCLSLSLSCFYLSTNEVTIVKIAVIVSFQLINYMLLTLQEWVGLKAVRFVDITKNIVISSSSSFYCSSSDTLTVLIHQQLGLILGMIGVESGKKSIVFI